VSVSVSGGGEGEGGGGGGEGEGTTTTTSKQPTEAFEACGLRKSVAEKKRSTHGIQTRRTTARSDCWLVCCLLGCFVVVVVVVAPVFLGTITKDELMELPELAMNPLLDRFISIFDVDSNKNIDFVEFVTALSVFSKDSNHEDKLKCACAVGLCGCLLLGLAWRTHSLRGLVAWLLGCLVAWLLGCLVAWLLGCLVAWLLGW